MKRITESEYLSYPKDYRGVWTTERWDQPNWEQDRERHMGKRTLLVHTAGGGTALLIEGISFAVVEDNQTGETTMNIIIKETGKEKSLSIIDPRTGVDFIQDFIGNHGALIDGQFVFDEDRDAWVCDQETYDWWVKVVNDNQALNDRIYELENELGSETVQNVVQGSDATDLEDHAAAVNQSLDEAFGSEDYPS